MIEKKTQKLITYDNIVTMKCRIIKTIYGRNKFNK